MADVTDRGQLIIVMGLLMAVAFVVLALLLNTVIFTENLASRGTDLGGRDAVEFQRTVQVDVGMLVDEENDREHVTNASVRANVSDGVDEIGRLLELRRAERGTVGSLTLGTMHNGAVIRQTDSTRDLNDSSDNEDWALAQDINDTRQFSMTITGGLNQTTQPGDGFNVWLQGGVDSWHLYVYNNSSTAGPVELAVQNGSEPVVTDVCSPSGLPLTVDLTAGTVNGTDCPAIAFAKGISAPYDIQFDNGHHATGTYNVTVNVSAGGSVQQTSLNSPGSGTSPYFVRAVYSLTVDLHYETADVVYGAEIRIARGEPS